MSPEPNLVVLCAELERLFELDELKEMSRELLGMDPETIGGGGAKGSFVKALATACATSDRIAALCDAVMAWRTDIDPDVIANSRVHHGVSDEIEIGDTLGPYLILRRLGRGRLGTVYLARRDGDDVRLKVLAREATYDRVGLQRFLTASRIIGTLGHPGLPWGVTAGEEDGRYYVAHRYIEGQTLASRIAKTGPIHLEEARVLLRGILEPLALLHSRRIPHGDIRPENVLIGSNDTEGVTLLDAGSHFLSVQPPAANGQSDRLGVLGSPKTLAPEQIEGKLADARCDLYSFGALCFEILTGRPVHEGRSPAETLMAHLTREAPLPSTVAPPGWIAGDVDDFVTELLNRNPARRPASVDAVLEDLDPLGSRPSVEGVITEEELEDRVRALLNEPTDEMAEEALVASIRQGADAQRVADTLCTAADLVAAYGGAAEAAAQRRLLARAAKLFDTSLKNPEAAEPLYARLVSLDPVDQDARSALNRIRKQLGKQEEIVEEYLERVESTIDPDEKAQLWAEIGRLYEEDLGDREQALVAYTQAYCESPSHTEYAERIERIAGKNLDAWNDVMASCIEATDAGFYPAERHSLLNQMGQWYLENIARPDLALPCFTTVLAEDGLNTKALEGAAAVYRKTQQWNELGATLLAQADAPGTPAPLSRDLRAEAAEILANKLGMPDAARELFEKVLSEDPSHQKATDQLGSLYERMGDAQNYVKLLERRAEALSGEEQLNCLFRIGELYEVTLEDIPEATRRYRLVVSRDRKHHGALQGLDRCLSQAGLFDDLIENLHQQIEAAATPRQKITLWERVAAIWDEEFLNHQKAAAAWENVLDLDPNHDNALTQLARHYRALERWNDVVVILERHIELLENDPDRKIGKALALGRVLGEGLRVPERAIEVYEDVLAMAPQHPEALEALASLRVQTGDTAAALRALEKLARDATTPAGRAEQYIRAAQILEAHGDQDGAIERYKLAVDANPSERSTMTILRAAYIARGDNNAAAELLAQEIKHTEGEAARAKLAGEMAVLVLDRLGDDARAESWAKIALDTDPTNLDALRTLGDIAYSAGRTVEATRHYDQVVNRTDALTQPEAVRILTAYIECQIKNGNPARALPVVEKLLAQAPDDLEVMDRVARFHFEHGEPQRSFELHWEYLHRAKAELSTHERAQVLYRLGESARLAGDLVAAREPLEEAAALDPQSNLPLRALAELLSAQGQWEQVVRTMYRQLENEVGEERIKLLLEIGDLASQRLKDPSYAAKSYLFALSEKPNDRKILTKLMQLYSEEKDWDRLVKVILKLADFVEDDKQKSKYLHTAGRIAFREMGDVRRASQLMQRSLELDPDNADILKEGLEVHGKAGNAEAMKELLKRQVKMASDAGDKQQMVAALGNLADLYLKHFKRVEQAIAVTEAALEVEPDNAERLEFLARLYASDTNQYRDKAIEAQFRLLKADPFRPDVHRTLRKLYTDAKRPDPAFCCCQALYVLGQADTDEERFFTRMRSEEGAQAKNRLTDADFHALLMHEEAEPLLTALFALIEPAVLQARAKPLSAYGFGREHLIDPTQHQFAAAQTIPWAADVLGMRAPPMLENPNDLGELGFLHAQPPSIVLGTSVVGVALPPQTATFMAARHLAYYRPGMYIRQLVPTNAGLKACLFAAIAMMAPQFPIPADLQGAVREALGALSQGTGVQRDHLARIVSKLVQSNTPLDLKKWTRGVDLTADRSGLILADDLQTAVEMIRASDPRTSAVSTEERVEEIYRYAVSERYFEVRRKLGIAIDL